MGYRIFYHPSVSAHDLLPLNQTLRERIRQAIERRLMTEPTYYGEPLRYRLKGYWKLRVGDYRIVFRVENDEVWVLSIGHRKQVYAVPPQRLIWRP